MTLKVILVACVLFLFTCYLEAHLRYQKKIPNGDKVPHPCKPNTIWQGVGHIDPAGEGERNPFGVAFAEAGFKWTKALCRADSDDDGKTNGEELGDPDCVWSEGKRPTKRSDLSHPGFCEPVYSRRCSFQKWFTCPRVKSSCKAKDESGVRSIDLRLSPKKVPLHQVEYYCRIFHLPNDKDYHIIGSDPIIHTRFVHHMFIYGCKGKMKVQEEALPCKVSEMQCHEIVAGWAFGDSGECAPTEAGYRFGKSALKYVKLEVHLEKNPSATGLYVTPGIRLYYTSKLRKYDLGVLSVGQLHLELPPGRTSVTANGVCNSKCTKALFRAEGSVHVTFSILHAHKLAKRLQLAQYRNGKFIRFLSKNDHFRYDKPIRTKHHPPVQLSPGDELRITCVYDTSKKKKTTYYGFGLNGEMCSAFFQYYPKIPENRAYLCESYGRYTFCDLELFKTASLYSHNFGTCNFKKFEQHTYLAKVLHSCGRHPKSCPKWCEHYVNRMMAHRCMKGYEKTFYILMQPKSKRVALQKALNVCAKKKANRKRTVVNRRFTKLNDFEMSYY